MIGEQQHVAELHINPPDLGPLEIKLTMDDRQATALFTSPHSAVREAVEAALPRLREVLADSGITLGNASVTADSPRDGSAFAQHHPRPQHALRDGTGELPAALPQTRATALPRVNALVDLFA